MISKLHQRLGTAGFIISIIALVAALGGGAYAASGGLTGKQKKEVEKIAKKYAGKPGATGATGQAGAKGDTGSQGAPGNPGAPGVGEKGEPGAAGTKGATGAAGSPWTAGGVLPEGQTETGSWSAVSDSESASLSNQLATISFPIPLAAELGSAEVHLISPSGKELVVNFNTEEVEEIATTECFGSVTEPAAGAGNLCVYIAATEGNPKKPLVFSQFILKAGSEHGFPTAIGASVSGARMQVQFSNPGAAWGTWAVTAAE